MNKENTSMAMMANHVCSLNGLVISVHVSLSRLTPRLRGGCKVDSLIIRCCQIHGIIVEWLGSGTYAKRIPIPVFCIVAEKSTRAARQEDLLKSWRAASASPRATSPIIPGQNLWLKFCLQFLFLRIPTHVWRKNGTTDKRTDALETKELNCPQERRTYRWMSCQLVLPKVRPLT